MANVSSNSLNQLSQTLGNITNTIISKQQQEAQAESKRQQIQAVNTIVANAVNYKNKLSAKEESSYVVDKRVKQKLIKEANTLGIPATSVLDTYKKHFEGGAPTDDNIKTQMTDSGMIKYNMETGAREFIPKPEAAIEFEDMQDLKKDKQKTIQDMVGVYKLGMKPSDIIDMANNPSNVAKYARSNGKFRAILDMNEKIYDLQNRKDLNNATIEDQELADKLAFKDLNVSDMIYESFDLVTSSINEYKTPEDAINAFSVPLNKIRRENPKLYQDEYAPIEETLRSQIENMHSMTRRATTAADAKNARDIVEARKAAIIGAMSLQNVVSNPELANILGSLEDMKDVDVMSIYKIAEQNDGINANNLFNSLFQYESINGNKDLTSLQSSAMSNALQSITDLEEIDFTDPNAEIPEELNNTIRSFLDGSEINTGKDKLIQTYKIKTYIENRDKVIPKLQELRNNLESEDQKTALDQFINILRIE